jgi:hypothetical protein
MRRESGSCSRGGPFRREGWVFEEKVDGYRITAIHSREVIARLGLVLAD